MSENSLFSTLDDTPFRLTRIHIRRFLPLRGEKQNLMNEEIALGMDISQGNLNWTV